MDVTVGPLVVGGFSVLCFSRRACIESDPLLLLAQAQESSPEETANMVAELGYCSVARS